MKSERKMSEQKRKKVDKKNLTPYKSENSCNQHLKHPKPTNHQPSYPLKESPKQKLVFEVDTYEDKTTASHSIVHHIFVLYVSPPA